jgi:hypothetical protein
MTLGPERWCLSLHLESESSQVTLYRMQLGLGLVDLTVFNPHTVNDPRTDQSRRRQSGCVCQNLDRFHFVCARS